MSVAIALFTRDLRVHDNPVLHAACRAATDVVPLFVLDTVILTGTFASPNRAVFLAEALTGLDAQCPGIRSGQHSPHLPQGGETAGRRIPRDWLAGPIHDYEQAHDDLAADGTSRLSPYLHFGCVSPTEALRAVDRSTPGGEAFSRQLAWRDFHHQVLAARPDTTTVDYRTRHDQWRRDEPADRMRRAGRPNAATHPVIMSAATSPNSRTSRAARYTSPGNLTHPTEPACTIPTPSLTFATEWTTSAPPAIKTASMARVVPGGMISLAGGEQ